MKTQDEKIIIIENALKYAHNKWRLFSVRPEWEREVISHILTLDSVPLQINTLWDTPVIWRTAAAVCISALIFMVCSLITNIGPEYEAARFLLEDPMGFIFAQPLFP
ncbi:MAG: hypothetical protein ABSB95_04310 [Dissulfurispiraceae bacterium]|jgi:hypothetical protein